MKKKKIHKIAWSVVVIVMLVSMIAWMLMPLF